MKRSIEASKRLSEIRERLNSERETMPEKDRKELEAEAIKTEREFRAALDTEAKADDEKAEAVQPLADRVECRRYLQAAMTERTLDGAERELQQELNLPETAMPFAALDPGIEVRAVEHRQDAATTIADAVVSKPRQSVLRRVFQRTDAAWLGVQMPAAPAGTPNYPVMTGGTTGSMENAGDAVDAVAATFTGTTIEPTRATARYLYRVEDAAKFGDLEAILRQDVREVLGDLMDTQIVAGDGTAPNISGFITNADNTGVADPTAVAKVGDFDAAFGDGIDGLYAYDSAGVRLLTGIETERFMRKTRINTGEQPTIREMTVAAGGTWRASKRVAAPASNIQKAYRIRTNEFRGIAPIWEGVQLIRDPYSGAAKGEIALTVLMLFGYKELRGGAKELRFKLA